MPGKTKAKTPEGKLVFIDGSKPWPFDHLEVYDDPEVYRALTGMLEPFVFRAPVATTRLGRALKPEFLAMASGGEMSGGETAERFVESFLRPCSMAEDALFFSYYRIYSRERLEAAGLADLDGLEAGRERLYVECARGASVTQGVFSHIRNSLAHGRIACLDDGTSRDPFLFMEDSRKPSGIEYSPGSGNKEKQYVTARMLLRLSTLGRWREVLEDSLASE